MAEQYHGTLKLLLSISCCTLNFAVALCELFHGEYLWDMLSLEDVPGFFNYSAGLFSLSGQLQLIAQVCDLIPLEIDLI